MSTTYTIGIVAFDGVLTSEVIGPAEVFSIASKQEWWQGTRVLLVGVEPQAMICTDEGIRIAVDATIADDLDLDVLLIPGGNDIDALLRHEGLNAFIQKRIELTMFFPTPNSTTASSSLKDFPFRT